MWRDIAAIVFICTTANHLGLIEAVEGVIHHRLPILNCSKCASFWSVLVYSLLVGREPIASVAVSFMSAYAAVWLVLLYGYIDTLYNRWYENIYTEETGDDAGAEG